MSNEHSASMFDVGLSATMHIWNPYPTYRAVPLYAYFNFMDLGRETSRDHDLCETRHISLTSYNLIAIFVLVDNPPPPMSLHQLMLI